MGGSAMNGIDAAIFVLVSVLGINAPIALITNPDPQVDMPIYCTVGDPELPTAQPFAIGRSGDQNETTNLAIVAVVDGDKLRVLGALGFCGWRRVEGVATSCPVNDGALMVNESGEMTFKPKCDDHNTPSGEYLARQLGMVLCGRQVWWGGRVGL